MGVNLRINRTKENIANAINESQLPISIIKMILDGIYQEVQDVERKELQKEFEEEQKELQDKQNEENKNNQEGQNDQEDQNMNDQNNNSTSEKSSDIVERITDAEVIEPVR